MSAQDAARASALSKRNKANRRKGAGFEADLIHGLRDAGYDVEGLRKAGSNDEGDLSVKDSYGVTLVEAKNAAKFEPANFMGQAEVEAGNYAKRRRLLDEDVTPVAIVKRRGHNWRKAYVLTTVEHYFDL